MLSKEEYQAVEEIVVRNLALAKDEIANEVAKRLPIVQPKAVVTLDFAAEEACSSCGLTMAESKLLASVRNGEVVVVPMDLFRDMLDNVKDTSVWEYAVKLLAPV